MQFAYCPLCGKKLAGKSIGDEGIVPFCDSCNRPWFSFSYPCVLILVINEYDEIALLMQNYISNTRYVVVAGYMKANENAETTVAREVMEEIGFEVANIRYIKSYSYPKKDNLMLGFVCNVTKNTFKLSGEVDSAKWFTIPEAIIALSESTLARQLLQDYLDSRK